MLKNYWFYIIISLILIITLRLIKSDTRSSIIDKNEFNIEDVSLITKVFLADRNGQTITLEKKAEEWFVNDTFLVRKDAIATLLSTCRKIRIKKPVPRAALDNVVQFIATTAVYVEFFETNKMVKAYWIGSNTPDHLGTYMLLKDSEAPFVMHIPSFNGFLSPRYGIQGNTLNISDWRSNTVFNMPSKDIKKIKYTDCLNQENSYLLKSSPLQLINSDNTSVTFNDKKVLTLLNSFKDVNCEVFKKDKEKINYTTQLEELIVNSDTLRTYRISDLEQKTKQENFTVDRKYATLNNGDLMLIQDYVFNKVLINITELTK